MTQDTQELWKKGVKGVQDLNRNRFVHGYLQFLNLRFDVADFCHEFLDILAITIPNFV